MDALDQQLLELYQRDLPLSPSPYREMAEALGSDEATVIERLQRLQQEGIITRVGPVFNHHRAGASTLVAVSAPEQQLEAVAEQINAHPGVNHNYQREHQLNLWFVATATDQDTLQQSLQEIEQSIGLPLLILPMEKAYHIDLGFKPRWSNTKEGKS